MKRSNLFYQLVFLIVTLFIIGCKKKDDDIGVNIKFNPTLKYGLVTDIDGNEYKTISIGGREWMAENLKVTHYNNGSPINNYKDENVWSSAYFGAYCINDNINGYKETYGALYNYYTLDNNCNVCPLGWHVPSYSEWFDLSVSLGGPDVAGEQLKEEGTLHWSGTYISSNSSGFTALPGGARFPNGDYSEVGREGFWWSSTPLNTEVAVGSYLSFSSKKMQFGQGYFKLGASIRCIKDGAFLKTLSVSDIGQTTATCGGRLESKNTVRIVEKGVCWSTKQNPTIDNYKTSDGTGLGFYSSSLKGLKIDSTYYVRAYAKTEVAVLYGDEVSFTTLKEGMATVNTLSLGNLTKNSVESGGCIVKDGGLPITSRGVCWSTTPNPTIDLDTKTVDGSGLGSFISKLTGLVENNTYYVRAYATNSKATTYGNEIKFTINDFCRPAVLTSSVKNVNGNSATCGGSVINDGGFAVTERGVCWSTSPNPTIEQSNRTIDGMDNIAFVSNVLGLEENTTYFIRAYAINSYGTDYGDELSFKTLQTALPTLTTADVTNIKATSVSCGGNVSNDGNLTLTVRGLCWSTSPNPTVESGNIANCGSGLGSFSCNIEGLTNNTQYYIRAFATNDKGTAYGGEKNITTLKSSIPTITYTSLGSISLSSANCGVYLGSDGNMPISERGICWSTSPNPTIESGNKVVSGSTSSNFTCSITGLSEGTKYYVRGYAINGMGIGYGQEVSFTTLSVTVPILSGIYSENIGYKSADFDVYLSNDGNSPLNERGICWSVSPNPTIENGNKIIGETTLYWAEYNISGLEPNTTYYAKGYATNGKGVGYSPEKSFKTLPLTVPKLNTLNASYVTSTSLTIGGSITDDGGANVLDRGICWSTSPNPTIELSDKISLGAGNADFTGSINGLTDNAKYYFRAYATNNLGIGYGNEVEVLIYFGNVTDIDGNVYNTQAIGTQIWMTENLKTTKYCNGEPIQYIVRNDEWSAQTNGAYGLYNNDINNKDLYGALYNGYSVMDNRKLCPIGWHMPANAEWDKLMNYLGGYEVAGGKMKATTLWESPNTGADNSSGFNAFASGERVDYNGTFRYLGKFSKFWSFNNYPPYWLSCYKISLDASNLWSSGYETEGGISVRCLKDQ